MRWDGERAARNHARLIRVAREAAMQSRRTWLPEVGVPVTFAQAAQDVGRRSPVALAQPGGRPPSLDRPALLVGPEGGWGAEELASGLPTVGLGQGVLRVETAAVAAGVLLCALRAGIVAPGANDA